MITIVRCGNPNTRPRMKAIASNTVPGKIAQSIKALWGDTDGVILPYVTVMLVVIVGVSVLALDGSGYMSLPTQLQNGADALALAGAAELDRTPTAIERATRAINGLITNSSSKSIRRNVRSRASISYARCRHATATVFRGMAGRSDAGCVRRGHGGADWAATILPASFSAARMSSRWERKRSPALIVICRFTPIFICNPFETAE